MSRWPILFAEALLLLHCRCATAAAATTASAGDANAANSSTALTIDAGDTAPVVDGSDLYLATTLNGVDRGLVHFGYRDGALWATASTLRQLGFALPAGTPDPVRLDALEGVHAGYDEAHQSAGITAPAGLLHYATEVVDTHAMTSPEASVAPGLLLNYNLYGSEAQHGASSLNAYAELRAFNRYGVFSNTSLSQTASGGGDSNDRTVRLDSTWSLSFPEQMLTLNVGDALTAATSWSRATRIGGVQFGTDFALQPYRVTTPLAQFFGSATLPSQVDLYVNGMKQYSGNVPVGPFQINTVPGINGAGNAQVVLTDALGQVTTLNFALYNTPQLLQMGLNDWSAELGAVRENYGIDSFDYAHEAMGSATWLHGFSDNFTGEAHAEATPGLWNGGVGGVWSLPDRAGVLSGSIARSDWHGSSGSQFGFGYNWTDGRFNVAVNGTRASSGYRDVASLYGTPPPRLSGSAQAGFNSASLGSFGLGYTHLDYRQQVNRYASAFWSRSFGRLGSLNFNANRNLEDARDRSLFLTWSVSLDDRTYASASVQHGRDGDLAGASAARSIPVEGGFGWRAQAQAGGGLRNGLAELDYLGRYGQVQAGVSDANGEYSGYANATGSLVLMGGGLFAARTVYDGFAVVSTDGVAGVPVKLQNNLYGVTDKDGLLLVTPLNAYQNNRIDIDAMNLPADLRIDRVEAQAVPERRAGTLVRFAITPMRAAVVVLVDASGKPLPLGAAVRVRGEEGEPALVGYDGEVYFDTLAEHDVLDVDAPAGACSVAFDYRKQDDGGIPRIGPLTCAKGASP
ncbi:MAG: fimbria/pilus outer membrane usher protein [Rudaea sp.]|uniref:fimbria/pilus outer membrane usher protein n=1 Tax=Rudaea sp. TaxID=2136325 RepID=UPI0039E4CEE0